MSDNLIRRVFDRAAYGPRQAAYRWLRRRSYRDLHRLATSVVNGQSLKPFRQHECIFVHIPKTGGASVAASLFGHLTTHLPLRSYQLLFDQSEFDRFFKFAFVRNPWDRLVSAYRYLRAGGSNANDRKWAREHLAPYPDFGTFVREWVNRKNIRTGRHFVPQYEFLALRDKEPAVDFLGRFEQLEKDYALICRRLSIPSPLKHLNASRRTKTYRDEYQEDTAELVADVYREDIALFGYDFHGLAEDSPNQGTNHVWLQ